MKKTIQELLLRYRYHAPPPTLKILYQGTEVAELKREDSGYRFRYLAAFKERGLEPLPSLPLDEEYKGTELPLYFRERLPDVHRADVRRIVKQLGIPTDDELLLLATLGKHTITDPFEFQLTAA
jgi:HipA-like protein